MNTKWGTKESNSVFQTIDLHFISISFVNDWKPDDTSQAVYPDVKTILINIFWILVLLQMSLCVIMFSILVGIGL